METTAAQAIEELILDYSKLVFHVIYGMTGHWEESVRRVGAYEIPV